jgi:hypothetical protein
VKVAKISVTSTDYQSSVINSHIKNNNKLLR